jgi:hypothetical protein
VRELGTSVRRYSEGAKGRVSLENGYDRVLHEEHPMGENGLTKKQNQLTIQTVVNSEILSNVHVGPLSLFRSTKILYHTNLRQTL